MDQPHADLFRGACIAKVQALTHTAGNLYVRDSQDAPKLFCQKRVQAVQGVLATQTDRNLWTDNIDKACIVLRHPASGVLHLTTMLGSVQQRSAGEWTSNNTCVLRLDAFDIKRYWQACCSRCITGNRKRDYKLGGVVLRGSTLQSGTEQVRESAKPFKSAHSRSLAVSVQGRYRQAQVINIR